MLWYLGYGTIYLLIIMGHKLLVIVKNYQNTELKEWIAFNVIANCVVTGMFGCVH